MDEVPVHYGQLLCPHREVDNDGGLAQFQNIAAAEGPWRGYSAEELRLKWYLVHENIQTQGNG